MQKNTSKRSDGSGNGAKGKYGRLPITSKAKKEKKKKVIPKSKHHTIAKQTKANYSINKRVAAVKAKKDKVVIATASGKKKSVKTKEENGTKKRSGGDGRGNGGPKKSNTRSGHAIITKNNFKSRGRKKTNYQMRLGSTYYSFSNNKNNNQRNANDPHLKYSDVPWCDAELQDRFRDNQAVKKDSSSGVVVPSNAISTIASYSSSSSSGILPQLPSETILQGIDDEIHSFSMYVRLTHTERRAREMFLDHVTEQAAIALLDIPSYTSFQKNNANRERNVRGRGKREEEGHAAAEKRRVHVVPFGSFATQEVCCFASDVDMCLWGVVECEPSSTGGDVYIGDDGDGEFDSDVDDGKYHKDGSLHANDDGVGSDNDGMVVLGRSEVSLPLLTESSLLRTMDALQSASALAAANDGGVGAVAAKGFIVGASSLNSASSTAKIGQVQQRLSHSILDIVNREVDECLFFIDREGEAAEVSDSKGFSHINDSSATHEESRNDGRCQELGKYKSMPVIATDSASSLSPSAEGFHFDIGKEGVKEVGGCTGDVEVVDLTSLDGAPLPDDAKESASRLKDERAQCGQVLENCGGDDVKSPCHDTQEQTSCGGGRKDEVPTKRGTSTQSSVIEINDDNSNDDDTSEVVMVKSVDVFDKEDDDDNDSADKMSTYYRRQDPVSDVQRTRKDLQASPIILLDDDSSSSSADLDEEDSSSDSDCMPFQSSKNQVMELSLTSNIDRKDTLLSGIMGEIHAKKPVVGPTGKARTQVVSALISLTRQLRMSNFTHTIECRTKARVPIINCSTRTGFEGDIAIGGHNGVDTSMYAMSQVKRFRSFAPIVLLLKVILAQQGLDKPFTGGLGSYRLYVLAALAIERHLANGGNDRPSEVLISLLFRYGCIGTHHHNQSTMTDLERLRDRKLPVSCDGGVCDLELVFRISDCVDMFRECHARLFARILMVNDAGSSEKNVKLSFLSSMIDCFRLREARETSDRRSKMCDTNIVNTPVARNDPGKVNGGRRIGKVFSKNDGPENWKRGPRGNILPKKRPDLEAKNSSRDREALLQRAMKNRKNNKKQKRDVALREFAARQLHG